MCGACMGTQMCSVVRYLAATTLAVGLFGAGQASAAPVTLFDSITGQSIYGMDDIYTAGPIYASFSTGSSASTLTAIDVVLVSKSGSPDTINVSLFSSDESTTPPGPGISLDYLGSIDGVHSGSEQYALTGLTLSLTANARYWIELTSNGEDASWAYNFRDGGTGVSTEYWEANYSSGPHPNAGDSSYIATPYEMIVDANTVGATPLPATAPLLTTGLGALGLLGRRRKRNNKPA